MFLRSLSVRGFKSFADRTILEFTPGISVIVGPNGSGKSNLVDAISWVLGEQGPTALRGGQMADVIFAGSPARPALGMAEVKLTIDNTAGLIPVAMSEIEISRAIFRSGESEYRINGQSCRLLDILELLSETGIGRALHTVIGQGQLEDVLTARPEERRRYLEEAAGISKHKRRKERAERKLGGLEQDLLRLQDVLAELRRQLKPLRQQAEMATRHEQLTSQADELAWRVAAARLRDLYAERERRTAGWDEGLALRSTARGRLDELDEALVGLQQERERAAKALGAAEAGLAASQEEKSAAEAALREAIDRESEARSKLAAEAGRSARITQIDEESRQLREVLDQTAAELAQRERDLEGAEFTFRNAERLRREAEEERRRIADEEIAHRAEVRAVRRSLATAEAERERLEGTRRGTTERLQAAEAERERLEAEVERLDAEETPLSARQSGLERDRRRVADEVAGLEDARREALQRVALLRARHEDLQASAGARFVQRNPGRAMGLLRDFVRAEAGLERALAAALGPFADAVVYTDASAALADAPGGRGAVLAVAGRQPTPFSLRGERALLDAVRADERVLGLLSRLLHDVYVVDDPQDLGRKHREHPMKTFVSPDGVMVGPELIHTASESGSRLAALRQEIAAAERDAAAADTALRSGREQLAAVDREVQAVDAALRRLDAQITATAEAMGRLDHELASLRTEDGVTAERLAGLDEALAGWRAALSSAPPDRREGPPLPPLPEHPVAQRVEVETLRRERGRFEAALARLDRERRVLAAEDPDALRVSLAQAEAERAGAEERLRLAEDRLGADVVARNAAAGADRRATEAEAETNRAWREAAGELERLRQAYEQEDRARGDLDRRISDAERLLGEGHGRDPAEAVGALEEDDQADVLEKRAELVARRLSMLGRVNLLAGGEFEALQERHDFMARELDDVRAARRDLLEVIRRVDDEVVRLFDAAFRDMAREFEALFADLFPGGEGRVVLTDPADLLASGIEVEARPGRKRVRRISLLSGGERALTALAFLFAIFRARPSPFYLLDEVEAALDDVNLSRFIRLIEGFARDSQVIVVTHQKRTMEAADILYGVSMRGEGASAVISQRFDRGVPAEPDEVAAPEPEPQPDAVR